MTETGESSGRRSASTESGRTTKIIDHYDALSERTDVREFYGGSDFMNFGFWDEDTVDQRQACENLMEELLKFVPDRSGTLLDVACGKGASTAYLTRYFAPERVTGVNISEKQLDIARRNAPGCTFRLMSATELDFPDGSFDTIFCVEAAFHFDTRQRFLEEAHRVMKPGGVLVLSDILMNLEGERKREMRTVENYLQGPEAYDALLKKAGFRRTTVIDATESCWDRHFWHTVHFVHRKFLERKIGREQLQSGLRPTYERVPDLEYYLLVAAEK